MCRTNIWRMRGCFRCGCRQRVGGSAGCVDQSCCAIPPLRASVVCWRGVEGLQMTSETRKWKAEIRETRGIRVGWQEGQCYIEDRSNGTIASMLELADRLRTRSLHKKEKSHERTACVSCVAKSLTPEGVSYRSTTARTSGGHGGACRWSCRS
jgi:hypothetical protein